LSEPVVLGQIMNYWMRFLGLPDGAEAATAARLAQQKEVMIARGEVAHG
jgi:hypothetical protein